MLVGQRSPERPLGKPPAEFAQACLAVGGRVPNTGQLREVTHDVARDLDRRIGRGLVPGLGDRRPALVADTAVVRREGGGQGERFGERLRRQVALRNHLRRSLRQLPQQRDRRVDRRGLGLVGLRIVHALFGPREFQPQRIGPAAHQEDRRAILRVIARLHPGIDQRLARVVDPEPAGMIGANDELVFAGFRREQRAGPANRELVRLDLLGKGRGGAEIERHLRVDPVENPGTEAEPAAGVVFPLQAALLAVLPR